MSFTDHFFHIWTAVSLIAAQAAAEEIASGGVEPQ